MSEPKWLEVYRRPAAPLIKAAVIAWRHSGFPEDRIPLDGLAAALNNILGIGTINGGRLRTLLEVLSVMDDVDRGDYPFETRPDSEDRPDEESILRDDIDDQMNTVIGGMV